MTDDSGTIIEVSPTELCDIIMKRIASIKEITNGDKWIQEEDADEMLSAGLSFSEKPQRNHLSIKNSATVPAGINGSTNGLNISTK